MLFGALILTGFQLHAQQEDLGDQYMFSGLVANPAYAGSHERANATISYRRQWTGMTGAPETALLSVDGAIANDKFGLGLVLRSDQIGVTRTTDIYGNYAYHMPLGATKLALGIRFGATLEKAQLDQLIYWDESDPVFSRPSETGFAPNAGAGVYWYGERHYVGFSVPRLIEYEGRDVSLSSGELLGYVRHYYLTGGYAAQAGEHVVLKPSFVVKAIEDLPMAYDVNLNVLFAERFWVGGGYRSGKGMVAMAEFNATEAFRIGYAYDYPFSELGAYTSGSHEIMLSLDFGKKEAKVKTPRYF